MGSGLVTIGLDLGQKRDPTALAVVEAEARQQDGRREIHHVVRHLERLTLGTSYPHVAERVVAICAGVARLTGRPPALYVDATGLGQPVVDIIQSAGVKAKLTPVYFTHGDRRTQEKGELRLARIIHTPG